MTDTLTGPSPLSDDMLALADQMIDGGAVVPNTVFAAEQGEFMVCIGETGAGEPVHATLREALGRASMAADVQLSMENYGALAAHVTERLTTEEDA